jgi:hypothetical protein
VKLHAPTTPFARIVTRRRRERAAVDAESFRLGGPAPSRDQRAGTGLVALVGASASELGPERVEQKRPEQLVALHAPGLAIGTRVNGPETWSSIEPEGQPDTIEFVRAALDEIRRLTEGGQQNLEPDRGEGPSAPATNARV